MSTATHIRIACLLIAPVFCAASWGQEPKDSPTEQLSSYELRVKYAETRMQLAEIELRHAIAINRESPGSIPRLRIERLRSALVIAKQQRDESLAASRGGSERVQLQHAREQIRLALVDLEAGRKLKDENMIQPLELERLELKYDLAQLKLRILNNPANFTTLLHYVETKVDRLADEILALDQRISKLEPARGIFPKNP